MYEPEVTESEFTEYGYTVATKRFELDDGSTIVDVLITDAAGETVTDDRFAGYHAYEEASSWIGGFLDAHDPDRPSLEERLAPFGEEWHLEQMEERGCYA